MSQSCSCCSKATDSFTIHKYDVCDLCRFLIESNKIEGIYQKPRKDQIYGAKAFLELEEVRVEDLCNICNVFESGALLRTLPGMDVRVGNYIAPKGGPEIILDLQEILESDRGPYFVHKWFLALHPFMDGNGRTSRIYWLWQMTKLGLSTHLGFLHTYYYQTLAEEIL